MKIYRPRASHKSSVSIEVPRPGTTSQTIPKVNVQPATPITNRGKAQNRESFGVWSKSVQDGIPQEGGVALLRRVSKQAEREQFYRTRQEAKKVYREAGITPTVAAFPPRSSSLSNSPTSIHSSKTPKQKASGPIVPQPFVNHMARPTAASAAREAQAKTSLLQRGKNTLKKKTPESTNKYVSTKPTSSSTAGCLAQSGSMTSVKRSSKGFKSRFSSILPGRRPSRHSSDQVQNTGLKRASITIISSKSTTDNKTAAFYQQKHNVSPNLTTFEDSGMDLSPSDIIRTYPGGNIYYDPSDKLAPELEEQDSQAAEIIASEVHAVSNGARQRVHPAQSQGFSRLPRDDEDPPTSPLTRDGPGGHYAEYENQDDTDPFDETGVSRYLDEQLSDAQNSLNRAIQAGQEIQSQELRDMISNVVQ